jgi:hypothetical protein
MSPEASALRGEASPESVSKNNDLSLVLRSVLRQALPLRNWTDKRKQPLGKTF